MRKVLITGAGGFIGSHLAELMVESGYEVRALVSYRSNGSWGWLEALPKSTVKAIEVLGGDVRDSSQMNAVASKVDTVFHLAALISIPYSYQAVSSYVDTNIKGTLNVLNAALKNNVDRVLVTSTSEVYGSAIYTPIDEGHPRQPQSPYSASKIGADSIAVAYSKSFNLPLTIVRPFNTFGPRQSTRAVIPTIIVQLLAGNRQLKLGAVHTTRDFLYVKDTARGFLEVAKSQSLIGEDVNLATGAEISIQAIAQKIMKIVNLQAELVQEQQRLRPEESEVQRLCGSNTKILSNSAWTPTFDVDAGLEETVQWFDNKQNMALYRSSTYSI